MHSRLSTTLLLASALLTSAAVANPIVLRNVRVIDMVTPGGPRSADVVIQDDRIVAVVEPGKALVASAREIDGKERFLIPGLAEMHAHLPTNPDQRAQAEDLLALFVANGVTNIRSMLGDRWHLALRDELSAGKVLGPRMFAGAPSLNGGTAPDPETGARLAREYAAAKFDFLKLHPGLKRDVFDAIVKAANETGIPFGVTSPTTSASSMRSTRSTRRSIIWMAISSRSRTTSAVNGALPPSSASG